MAGNYAWTRIVNSSADFALVIYGGRDSVKSFWSIVCESVRRNRNPTSKWILTHYGPVIIHPCSIQSIKWMGLVMTTKEICKLWQLSIICSFVLQVVCWWNIDTARKVIEIPQICKIVCLMVECWQHWFDPEFKTFIFILSRLCFNKNDVNFNWQIPICFRRYSHNKNTQKIYLTYHNPNCFVHTLKWETVILSLFYQKITIAHRTIGSKKQIFTTFPFHGTPKDPITSKLPLTETGKKLPSKDHTQWMD